MIGPVMEADVVNLRLLLRMAMYIYFAILFCVVSTCSYGLYQWTNMCAVYEFGRYPSPDGLKQAVVYEVACGATSSLITEMSIVTLGGSVSPNDDREFLSLHGLHKDLSPKWQGNSVLKVPLPKDEKIYRKDKRAGGASISYGAGG